jgi:hypothetical protein
MNTILTSTIAIAAFSATFLATVPLLVKSGLAAYMLQLLESIRGPK